MARALVPFVQLSLGDVGPSVFHIGIVHSSVSGKASGAPCRWSTSSITRDSASRSSDRIRSTCPTCSRGSSVKRWKAPGRTARWTTYGSSPGIPRRRRCDASSVGSGYSPRRIPDEVRPAGIKAVLSHASQPHHLCASLEPDGWRAESAFDPMTTWAADARHRGR